MSEAGSDSLFQVAKVLKSNGTEGGLLLGFRDVSPEDIDLEEPVFIPFDGLPVPFFIDSFTRKGRDKAIVLLTDIRSLEDAEELVGREVFVEEDTLPEYEDDGEMDLSDFIGWTICDDKREVGKVADYEDIPGNPCLYVDTPKERIMIPLHQDFVVSLDESSRVIYMVLPQGLV